MALNLGFLFCIAALPFPTSVIAQEGDVPVAAALYAAFGVLTGTMSLILWRYPARAGLVISTVTPEIERYITYRISVVPIMFALSIPIAFVNPYLAWFWWIAIFLVQQLVAQAVLDRARAGPRRRSRATRRSADPGGPRDVGHQHSRDRRPICEGIGDDGPGRPRDPPPRRLPRGVPAVGRTHPRQREPARDDGELSGRRAVVRAGRPRRRHGGPLGPLALLHADAHRWQRRPLHRRGARDLSGRHPTGT